MRRGSFRAITALAGAMLLLLAGPVFADAKPKEDVATRKKREVEEALRRQWTLMSEWSETVRQKLSSMSYEPARYCSTDPLYSVPDQEKCRKAYLGFYKEGEDYSEGEGRGIVKIRVSFGYDNEIADPATGTNYTIDLISKALLIEKLTRRCQTYSPSVSACGFERDSDDADELSKIITGPDGLRKKVVVRVVQSSVSGNHEENLSRKDAQRQRDLAEANFLDESCDAQAIFYGGHSRDGGGPDFQLPRLLKNGHVDYDWYRKHRPGLGKTLEMLKRCQKKGNLKILGLFSCSSETHFWKRIHEVAPNVALVGSSRLVFGDESDASLYASLNALLGLACKDEFERQIDEYYNFSGKQPGFNLKGFF